MSLSIDSRQVAIPRQSTQVSQPNPAAPSAPGRTAGDSLQLSSVASQNQAPAGRTPIGTAVNKAVWATNNGTVDRNMVFTQGSVGAITRPQYSDTWAVEKHVVDLINQSKNEVRIHMFNFHANSQTGTDILNALAAKQKENPNYKIYIIQNLDSSNPTSHDLQDALIQHGIDAQVATFHHMMARSIDHTKQYIFDGSQGMLGGSNIGDHPRLEKDLMVDVQGPVVNSMLADFNEAWKASDIHFGTQDGKAVAGIDTLPAPETVARPAAPEVPLTFLSRKATTEWAAHTGDPIATNSDQAFLAAMGAAKTSINIESPNFNDPVIWKALTDAAARGVKVQVLLPRDFNRLTASVDGASNPEAVKDVESTMPKSALANFDIRWFSYDGQNTAPNHTKFMAVDGQWAYVGSQNMDKESWVFSQETGIGVDDPTQAQRLDTSIFENDWRTGIPVNASTVQLNTREKIHTALRNAYETVKDPIALATNLVNSLP